MQQIKVIIQAINRLTEWFEQRKQKRELEQRLGDAWAEFMGEIWGKR